MPWKKLVQYFGNRWIFNNEPCFNCPTKFFSEYLCVGIKIFTSLNNCPLIDSPPKEICPNPTDSTLNNQIWQNFEPVGATLNCPSGKNINVSCVFLGFDNLHGKNNPQSISKLTAVYRHDYTYLTV